MNWMGGRGASGRAVRDRKRVEALAAQQAEAADLADVEDAEEFDAADAAPAGDVTVEGDDEESARPTTAVDFYAKPGCHLCEEAREVLDRVVVDRDVDVREHDILQDPELQRRYGELIPVVVIDGVQHAQWRLDEGRFAAALDAAAAAKRG